MYACKYFTYLRTGDAGVRQNLFVKKKQLLNIYYSKGVDRTHTNINFDTNWCAHMRQPHRRITYENISKKKIDIDYLKKVRSEKLNAYITHPLYAAANK